MSKILISLSLLLLFTSCENVVNSGYIPEYSKYPVVLNKEWEYNTRFILEYYDSTGRIDTTEIIDVGNTICRITSINDSLANYNKLCLFEEYDVATPQFIHKNWYLNADSGLYAIAYLNPGSSQFIVPTMHSNGFEHLPNFIKGIRINPAFNPDENFFTQLSDSVQFYTYPRKVLKYPVRVGQRWIELIEPFYRERFINKTEKVDIDGKIYSCFKVESNMDFKTLFNDYINLNSGLVKREFLVDSIAIIGENSPDTLGYYRFTSISKLVRETNPE